MGHGLDGLTWVNLCQQKKVEIAPFTSNVVLSKPFFIKLNNEVLFNFSRSEN